MTQNNLIFYIYSCKRHGTIYLIIYQLLFSFFFIIHTEKQK